MLINQLKRIRLKGTIPYLCVFNGIDSCLFELNEALRLRKIVQRQCALTGLNIVYFTGKKELLNTMASYDIVLGSRVPLLFFDGTQFFKTKYVKNKVLKKGLEEAIRINSKIIITTKVVNIQHLKTI
jgi:hypothetical protein